MGKGEEEREGRRKSAPDDAHGPPEVIRVRAERLEQLRAGLRRQRFRVCAGRSAQCGERCRRRRAAHLRNRAARDLLSMRPGSMRRRTLGARGLGLCRLSVSVSLWDAGFERVCARTFVDAEDVGPGCGRCRRVVGVRGSEGFGRGGGGGGAGEARCASIVHVAYDDGQPQQWSRTRYGISRDGSHLTILRNIEQSNYLWSDFRSAPIEGVDDLCTLFYTTSHASPIKDVTRHVGWPGQTPGVFVQDQMPYTAP